MAVHKTIHTNNGNLHRFVFEDFLDGIEEDTEITVHAEAYLYGEGETFKASIEEVAYFTLRMSKDDDFLSGHCDHIESVDFTCNYSPDELFGMDWGVSVTEKISALITTEYNMRTDFTFPLKSVLGFCIPKTTR